MPILPAKLTTSLKGTFLARSPTARPASNLPAAGGRPLNKIGIIPRCATEVVARPQGRSQRKAIVGHDLGEASDALRAHLSFG